MISFNKVGEGIYKKSNAIDLEDCAYIYNYMYNNCNSPDTDINSVPWIGSNSNVLYYNTLEDRKIIDIINRHKKEMSEVLTEIAGEPVYPHLTTIVLWKPGQSMGRHVDNGSQTDHQAMLQMRDYTSVAYMNDDFVGGETFLRSDGKTEPNYRSAPELFHPNNVFTDYISKPEQGAVILFGGGDSNAHGVTKLEEGIRVILSTWYTTDPNQQEVVL